MPDVKVVVGVCREDRPADVDETYGVGTYERLFPDGGVTRCPFCGGKDLMLNMVEWEARSLEPMDANNACTFQEHQCQECIKSFWS